MNFLDSPTHQGGAPFDRAFVADDTGPTGKNKEFAHCTQEVFLHPDFRPCHVTLKKLEMKRNSTL